MTPLLRRCLLVAAALPAAGLALAALAPTRLWACGLAAHWAPQLAVLTLPLWCWLGRRPLPGAAIVALLAAALWPWLLAANAARAPAPGPDAAVAVSANLYVSSPRHAEARARLDGDVLALIETLADDREALADDPRWPHQHWIVPRRHGGMALLSRWPMRSSEIAVAGAPAIEARIDAPWGPLRVIAVHLWSPSSPAAAAGGQRQAEALAALAAAEPGPLLVLGDLNATPASPTLRRLHGAGLLPPATGSPATWPWLLGPAGIAIDHVLGRDLALGRSGSIDLPGSDHRAIRVGFGPVPR